MRLSDFFKEQVAIVTGASSGIGEAVARLLCARGARVVLAARRKEKLDFLSQELNGCLSVATDVTQEPSVKNLVAQTVERFGRIDILINNAGALLYKPMTECSLHEIRQVMETNFFGAALCARAVIPIMKKQKSGTIVNVASIAGRIGLPHLGYYGASKFALVGFSETLRQELAPDGIFVCTVCPGTVYTPMTKEIVDGARARGKKLILISAETVAQKILIAVEKKSPEIIIPFATRLFYFLHFFFARPMEQLAWKFRASDPPSGLKNVETD